MSNAVIVQQLKIEQPQNIKLLFRLNYGLDWDYTQLFEETRVQYNFICTTMKIKTYL